MPFRPSLTRALGLTLLLACATAQAGQSRQITIATDGSTITVGGQTRTLSNPPRLVSGRLLMPLHETLSLLSLPSIVVNDYPIDESGATTIDGQTYVDLRWLAAVTNTRLDIAPGGRQLILTAAGSGVAPAAPRAAASTAPAQDVAEVDPGAPQARFAPEKEVYAPGERISLVDYSFDPDGVAITSRAWSGRRDVYFEPGEYSVTLQVTNARGKVSPSYTRRVRVQGAPVASPLEFALRHTSLGDTFSDLRVMTYPTLAARTTVVDNFPLLFSDSPEKPQQAGILYRDAVQGRARLLAYHLNGLPVAARVHVLVRNLEERPVQVRSVRLGETAPSRVEGTLGQVALMDYLTSTATPPLTLTSGRQVALYTSPQLPPGSGVSLMQDIEADGRVEVTFAILPHGAAASQEAIAQLPVLPLDGVHQRGTFPGAVRRLQVTLDRLPARLNIGDGRNDAATEGVDALTGTKMKLAGNYGVLYQVEVERAAGTVMALAPRGGLYRGALQLFDGAESSTMRVPRSGVLTQPDAPMLLWRAQSDRLNFSFVPANGSNLPVSLVFYRSPNTETALKR